MTDQKQQPPGDQNNQKQQPPEIKIDERAEAIAREEKFKESVRAELQKKHKNKKLSQAHVNFMCKALK